MNCSIDLVIQLLMEGALYDFAFLFEIITNIILWLLNSLPEIVIGAGLLWLAWLTRSHQRKADKEVLRGHVREAQQQLNFMSLNNEALWRSAELAASGEMTVSPTDEGVEQAVTDVKRAMHICFIHINRIHDLWFGWQSEILTESDMLDEVRPILRLLLGERKILDYCLSRAYPNQFVEFIEKQSIYVLEQIPSLDNHDAWARDFVASKLADTVNK